MYLFKTKFSVKSIISNTIRYTTRSASSTPRQLHFTVKLENIGNKQSKKTSTEGGAAKREKQSPSIAMPGVGASKKPQPNGPSSSSAQQPRIVAEQQSLATQPNDPSTSTTQHPTIGGTTSPTSISQTNPNESRTNPTSANLTPTRSILMNKQSNDDSANTSTPFFPASKKVSFFPFKGLMAPVFTCFKRDKNYSVDVDHIDGYAKWLKSEGVNAVLVNSIIGEGPAMSVAERKQNAQAWWNAALNHNLVMMLQVGGAPLPDVVELAQQAEELGVHAVLCLPELFYKPLNVNQLVGYCKIVARVCFTRPFFYSHSPAFTNVKLNMLEFCRKAEERISCFSGIHYESGDLEMGIKCLQKCRIVLFSNDMLLAPAMLLGFESAVITSLNIHPTMVFSIYEAMKNNDIKVAQKAQQDLNALLNRWTVFDSPDHWVNDMKNWFNDEQQKRGSELSIGPPRRHC